MDQRTWITVDPDRVYVTIGLYRPEDDTSIIHELKHLVVINEYPDTVIDATLRFRKLTAEKLNALLQTGFLPRVKQEDLFFMVYRTMDSFEEPYLYSDNSPRNLAFFKEVAERKRRSRMTFPQRLKEDFVKWIHS